MVTVQVLMSTYNGSKYLREQMDSILQQVSDCSKHTILVRDDGSKDGTQKILEEYAQKYPEQITWYQGENLGAAKSFLELIQRSDENADYYAFADQDDVWLPDKLESAVKVLEKMGDRKRPRMYCGCPCLVNQSLEIIHKRRKRKMRVGFGNALIENIAVGCTTVIDSNLRDMMIEKMPTNLMMHDRWLYMVASCFGEVYYDETEHIYYRQHENNVVGMKRGLISEFCYRLTHVKEKSGEISAQAIEYWRLYRTVFQTPERQSWKKDDKIMSNMRLVKKFVKSRHCFSDRWELIRTRRLYRQRLGDSVLFSILYFFGFF